ncbi:hypothetical protein AAFC00_003444 [Neodothiora populina]|uniref:Ubiquitin-like domain-containing protein n=1 Tax=Neodothiora populina TaxID=2781224 RepID=A0ABR3PER7_9PEZI
MSETNFARAFMSAMDRKPIRLNSDYISDPKKYPAQSPYILPKPTHPFPRRERPDVAATPKTVSVNLKPMKSSQGSLSLPSQLLDTTVLDLKTQYASKHGLDVYKIKMLLNKKPCPDLKTLKDLLPSPPPASVDLTLMIMGGFSSPAPSSPAPASPAIELPDPTAGAASVPASSDPAPLSERAEGQAETLPHTEETAADMLSNDAFWGDLKSFLIQRLRDESEGERLAGIFRQAAAK